MGGNLRDALRRGETQSARGSGAGGLAGTLGSTLRSATKSLARSLSSWKSEARTSAGDNPYTEPNVAYGKNLRRVLKFRHYGHFQA